MKEYRFLTTGKYCTNFLVILVCLLTAFPSESSTPNIEFELLKSIRNIHHGNGSNIVTSGMPKPEQFPLIKKSKVDLVVNLVPKNESGFLSMEEKLVKGNGMQYAYIPVVAMSPSKKNLDDFFQVLEENKGKNILVHCKSNHRSSAFLYLYQLSKNNNLEGNKALHIMEPWGNLDESLNRFPSWKVFIQKMSPKLTSEEKSKTTNHVLPGIILLNAI